MINTILDFIKRSLLIFLFSASLTSVAYSNQQLNIDSKIDYGTNPDSGLNIGIPVKEFKTYKIKLLDQVISYRNDKKVHINFSLPDEIAKNTGKIEMQLEAYNDDSQ